MTASIAVDPQAAEQEAATELAVANQTLAQILADPGSTTGAKLAAAQAEVNLSDIRHRAAREANRIAQEQAMAERAEQFRATVGPAMAGHNESVLLSIEAVEDSINKFLTASGTREAARQQFTEVASTLGAFDHRAGNIDGVSLRSTRSAEATRLAKTVAKVYDSPDLGRVASTLRQLASSGPRL